jgi:hypothetical protein
VVNGTAGEDLAQAAPVAVGLRGVGVIAVSILDANMGLKGGFLCNATSLDT